MKIKVWGCRGSIPTPGKETLRYGGNTTCVEVRLLDNTVIIFDAGTGIRKLGQQIAKENQLNELYLYLTHAHWDHLMGFPFFAPIYMKDIKIHVRGGPIVKRSLKRYLDHQMEPPYFPVDFNRIQATLDFSAGDQEKREIGMAEILPVPLSHPNGGYGFKVVEAGKSFVFIPDNELDVRIADGLTIQGYVNFCTDADLTFHDSQYTDEEYELKRGWGHSQISSVLELGKRAGIKKLALFHHDPQRSDEELDNLVAYCRNNLKESGKAVNCFGAMEGMEIDI